VPIGFVEVAFAGGGGWIRADLAEAPPGGAQQDEAQLDWGRLGDRGRPLPGAHGRGGVVVANLGGCDAVVRPLRHGGALGKWLGPRYAGPGRVQRELAVHAALRARGIAVVPPLGAVWRREGWTWRLWFVTERVLAAPLTDFVADHPDLRRAAIAAAGTACAAAVRAGLEHPDFHPDNVLAAVGTRADGPRVDVWLIDFDRAVLADGPTPPAAVDRMLLRMARYAYRHAGRLGRPQPRDALRFLRGMGWDRAQRRAAVQRLAPRLRRAVARRGLDPS